MKHKTYFTYLILATLLTGCLKIRSKDDVAATKATSKPKTPVVLPKQVSQRELRLEDVFVEFIGQSQPDLYDVVFSWPETHDRVRLTAGGKSLATLSTQEVLQYKLSNLQGGRKLSILIEVLDQQNHIILSETRELEIPKDYIFPKNFRLTNHMNINNERVFLSGSVITTQNFNLTIKAKNIIVLEKSYLQNFEENQKAKPVSHGRSGGEIRIEADTAEGELGITMNSEAGGDGFKAVAAVDCSPAHYGGFCIYQPNCPQGGSGWNAGANGNLYVKINKVDNLKIYPQAILAEGGNRGPDSSANTPEGYPVFANYSQIPLLQCPQNPVAGSGAQPGKICLSYSAQMPEQGCE